MAVSDTLPRLMNSALAFYRDLMATQTFFHRTRAHAPVERAWMKLQEPATWRRIGGVHRLDGERFNDERELIGYDFAFVVGGQEYRGTASRAEVERGRRIAMSLWTSQMDGLITVDLEPDGENTRVDLSLTMSSRGFLAAIFFSTIANAVGGGFEEAGEKFVNQLES